MQYFQGKTTPKGPPAGGYIGCATLLLSKIPITKKASGCIASFSFTPVS